MLTELNKDTFEETVSSASTPLVVDFWAPWCGPCKALGPVLEEVAGELGDKAKVCKVNIDDNQELAVSLGIQSIPTLFFYNNGEKKDSHVGLISKGELVSKIESI